MPGTDGCRTVGNGTYPSFQQRLDGGPGVLPSGPPIVRSMNSNEAESQRSEDAVVRAAPERVPSGELDLIRLTAVELAATNAAVVKEYEAALDTARTAQREVGP